MKHNDKKELKSGGGRFFLWKRCQECKRTTKHQFAYDILILQGIILPGSEHDIRKTCRECGKKTPISSEAFNKAVREFHKIEEG